MSAYHVGFCDFCDGFYNNPFAPGTLAWRKYAAGWCDAKQARRLER